MQSKLCLYSAKRKGQTYLAKQMYHDPDGIYWTFFKTCLGASTNPDVGSDTGTWTTDGDRYSAHYGFEQ